jgi:SnoaL-like domain
VTRTLDEIADQLSSAFATKNLDALGRLLADDARWGDEGHPNRCRTRSDVVATFERLLGEGVDAEVTETMIGPRGIAVRLQVHWPDPVDGRGINFYQAYLVSHGLVTEIQRHDNRKSAIAALSS